MINFIKKIQERNQRLVASRLTVSLQMLVIRCELIYFWIEGYKSYSKHQKSYFKRFLETNSQSNSRQSLIPFMNLQQGMPLAPRSMSHFISQSVCHVVNQSLHFYFQLGLPKVPRSMSDFVSQSVSLSVCAFFFLKSHNREFAIIQGTIYYIEVLVYRYTQQLPADQTATLTAVGLTVQIDVVRVRVKSFPLDFYHGVTILWLGKVRLGGWGIRDPQGPYARGAKSGSKSIRLREQTCGDYPQPQADTW